MHLMRLFLQKGPHIFFNHLFLLSLVIHYQLPFVFAFVEKISGFFFHTISTDSSIIILPNLSK